MFCGLFYVSMINIYLVFFVYNCQVLIYFCHFLYKRKRIIGPLEIMEKWACIYE
jgi:hypothetical protein